MAKQQNHIFTKVRTGSQAEALAEALSGRNKPTPGKQISTVSALADAGMGLRISCTACGEEKTLSGKELETAFGKETLLSDIKAPCPACETTAVSRVPVSVK